MNNKLMLALLPCVLALPGCKVIPQYKLPVNAPHARVELSEKNIAGSVFMCQNDTRYRVSDKAGVYTIPAGERVTLGISYYNYVYNGVSTSCEASSSLIPTADGRYYMDFEIENEYCTALVFRKDDASRVGVAFEPTLQRARPCN